MSRESHGNVMQHLFEFELCILSFNAELDQSLLSFYFFPKITNEQHKYD